MEANSKRYALSKASRECQKDLIGTRRKKSSVDSKKKGRFSVQRREGSCMELA
jgi:hypothetical protein